jgi:hypothetical protein
VADAAPILAPSRLSGRLHESHTRQRAQIAGPLRGPREITITELYQWLSRGGGRGIRTLDTALEPYNGPRFGRPQAPTAYRLRARAVSASLTASEQTVPLRVSACGVRSALLSSRAVVKAPLARVLLTLMQCWSVRPCVRPVGAARMAAGHNASAKGSRPKPRILEMPWHKWVVPLPGSTGYRIIVCLPFPTW